LIEGLIDGEFVREARLEPASPSKEHQQPNPIDLNLPALWVSNNTHHEGSDLPNIS
jgi:hypothetical protein